MGQDLEIRRMTRGEMNIAVEWASREGWNPGINDAESFYSTYPEGFLMVYIDKRPAGCISAVPYGGTFGFIGFFMVVPELRGHRIGMELGKKAMGLLAGRNIGIDGVEKKVKNYEHFGFHLAYHNIRLEGVSEGKNFSGDGGCELADRMPFEKLVEFDARFFGFKRPQFLAGWIKQNGGAALSVREGEKIKGFGVIRQCVKGYKIGPLFADDELSAEMLLNDLIARIPRGTSFFLDVPEINKSAMALGVKYKMKAVFQTARMYNLEIPPLPVHKIYGVTSFELG